MTQNNTPTEVEESVKKFSEEWHRLGIPNGCLAHMQSYHRDTLNSLLTRLEEEKKKAVEEAVRKTLELFHEGANTEENFRHVLKALTPPTNQ